MTAVGVVGASGRAAAGSLRRAGFAAWAVDLFADRDLRALAPCARCPAERYPDALPELAAQFPPGPFLYTGGLENHPDIIRELASRRDLWGNGPDVLERVRDPFQLRDILHGKGFPYPDVLPASAPPPTDRRWLRKPFAGAGGHGIRLATPPDTNPDSSTYYFQALIPGPAMSVLFASTPPSRSVLLGVTEQLVGEPFLHAAPFQYCGSIGPVELAPGIVNGLTLMGYRVLFQSGICGVWGADFILQGEEPFVVEVNPRYTASVEVLEHATETPLLATPQAAAVRRVVGKAIYYAPHRITFPAAGPWDADLIRPFDPWHLPGFADIPDPGSVIEPGWPVLTFFATGSIPDTVRDRLQSTATTLDAIFREPTHDT